VLARYDSWPAVFQDVSLSMGLHMRPGEQLWELRNRLGITTREVEEFSRTIAEDSQNEEFYISNAWLTQLENQYSVSIYKLYSLSVIYRTKFNDLLAVFGIDLMCQHAFSARIAAAEYPLSFGRIARP
jgi:transcriptional regulator with XRE-family HTH domain